jgi:hypothetical protein
MGDNMPERIEHLMGSCLAFCGYFNGIFARQRYDFLMAICECE